MSNTKGTTAINSPKGGGALAGLGEKFSPDLFTGTGNFSVPIAVLPGRNGFQPELNIGYSSGNGNGLFGLGWALGIPGITRKTSKGIPVYDDKSDIFILSGAEDMVPVKIEQESQGSITIEKTYYRPRTEGLFARIIRYKKSDGSHYWEVRSKDGLISYYGTKDATSNDSCVLANPEKRDSIFAWYLSKTVDPFGNEIIYEYNQDLVISAKRNYDQVYVSNIKYTRYPKPGITPLEFAYLCEVRFIYEDRPDAFSAYKQGFEVRTTKRCQRIEIWSNAHAPIKTKTYHFAYSNTALNGSSLLQAVNVEGHKDAESEFMPPLAFTYSNFNPQKRDLYPVKGQLPGVSLADPGFELVDLDGNGLPDILQLNGVARRWPNLGNATFGPPQSLDVAPSVQLGMPGVQLIDADGDGKSDLLVNDGVKAGYFPGRFRTVWDNKSFRPYPQAPSFSFEDPEVKLIDLDGDGITDVLRNGSRFECFFNDPVKGFYKTRFSNKTFADFSFADPRIRFADMTGDGMQDIVFISSGKVQYWPNLGYGRFGSKVIMRNAPRFPEEYNPAQILLGDLDGDGLADIAFVEDNRVTLCINQSGNAFSEASIIKGTPRLQSPDAIRITDILGTGQAGLLWSYGAGEYTAGQMFFLDFTAGNKPYLLEDINNNMGCLTRVRYGSSVHHYLRDEALPETRWQTDLPFPILVVNKMEVLDLLSGGKVITEYLYHHGYWDGEEREFRGFGRVDVRDTESFERYNTNDLFSEAFAQVSIEHYTPPTETRHWFYQGPVGDGYEKWFEPDFTHEYWSGDLPMFKRTQEMEDLLAELPRRALRDALRTLRGNLLRSELYGIDNSPLQEKPYTVTESQMSLRLEFSPADNPQILNFWSENQGGYSAGRGYIFFPFGIYQRSTQWERGDDPLHTFNFSDGYDLYGQPRGQLSIGVPRGINPLYGGGQEPYLATYAITEFIYVDSVGQYMTDRIKRSVTYDATSNANGFSVFALSKYIFGLYGNIPDNEKVISASLNFYDGNAFTGLPYGEIGDYGILVRSESLISTDRIISDIYGNESPECFKVIPDWSGNNGYPADFEFFLQNGDVRLGYKDRRNTLFYPNHISGWYTEGAGMRYDFQEIVPTSTFKVGFAIESRDTFGNLSVVEYDQYFMFPIKAVDALGMRMDAEYDYRVLQAKRIVDPNLNISEFDFSPLGLLKATALVGKGQEGDWVSDTGTFYERFAPSTILDYDYFAFVTQNNPVWVQSTNRERHITDPYDTGSTVVSREYTDGLGRTLQVRTQAETVIFGNPNFGSSGLPADQSEINQPAVGVEHNPLLPPNVVVSGWQIYNNKGKVVEKYEPFFSLGFDYTLPQATGVKVKMYYDARGKVVRTVNPDRTESRIVLGIPITLNDPNIFTPTPWETYAYDSNDLAPITHPADNTVEPSHYFTPKSEVFDVLGRCVKTTEHIDKTDPLLSGNITMKYQYDITGNLLKVIDPYNRVVYNYKYDLNNKRVYGDHIDSGISVSTLDAIGQVIENKDEKGSWILNSYDSGSRNIRLWAKDNAGENITLRKVTIYGDDSDLANPISLNQMGKLYKIYDEVGLSIISEYDFKGNALENIRRCISDSELLSVFTSPPVDWNILCYRVDWTGLVLSILDAREFITNMSYDALNRITRVICPEDEDNERKISIPKYNKAGGLESLNFNGADYIKHIAYNAKGQRLMVAYGNTVMTRYTYHPQNFLLQRLKSEKYTQNNYEFTPVSGTKQDYVFVNDLEGKIITIKDRSPQCGVGGTDSIDRKFVHDPIYRLLSCNGRETARLESNPWDETYRPHDDTLSVSYNQSYTYDKLGNILSLIHYSDGTHDFTRTFNYAPSNNKLTSINVGGNTFEYAYDVTGNQLSETSSRHSEWDFSGNMRCFYVQAGTSEPSVYGMYLYDSAGNRLKKIVRTSGGAYESVTYVGGFEYKTDGTNKQTTLQLMDGRTRIATIRIGYDFGDTSPAIKYNLDDHLGSSVLELNEYGSMKRREEYYPFGETSFGSYAKKRYRFCSKEKDGESGFYYYGARYYSPWLCRFISVDPLADKYAQLSSYNYASNGPINGIDLDGLQTSNGQAESKDSTSFTPFIGFNPDMLKVPLHGTQVDSTLMFINDPKNRHLFDHGPTVPRPPDMLISHDSPIAIQARQDRELWDNSNNWIRASMIFGGLMWVLNNSVPSVGPYGIPKIKPTPYPTSGPQSSPFYGPQNYEKPVTEVKPVAAESVKAKWSEPQLAKTEPFVYKPTQSKVNYKPVIDNQTFTISLPSASKTGKYAFGLKDEVESFASEIGASHLMKDQYWKSSFEKIIAEPNNEIHFTLNGIDESPMNMILSPNRSGINWEMNTLYNNKSAFENTTFYYGGNTYKGYDVFKIKP